MSRTPRWWMDWWMTAAHWCWKYHGEIAFVLAMVAVVYCVMRFGGGSGTADGPAAPPVTSAPNSGDAP